MNKWTIDFSLGAAIILLSGLLCGCEVSQAVAERQDVVSYRMDRFPKMNIEFHANQIFLWPEKVTPQQVSRVLFLSDEIDRLEREITPLKNQLDDLDTRLQPIDSSIQDKQAKIRIKENQIKRQEADKKRCESKLSEIQTEETNTRSNSPPDPAELERLAQEIHAQQNQLATLQARIDTLRLEKSQLENEVKNLNQDPLLLERAQLRPKKQVDEDLKAQHLKEVTEIVNWYDPQPSEISFHFEEDGSIKASISKWGLSPDEVKEWDFSTVAEPGKKPTIENVVYREYGALFEFDVKVYEDEQQTQLRESYSFKIARTKYDSDDGKIYFTGTIKRFRMKDGKQEVREGIAKLTDKNN